MKLSAELLQKIKEDAKVDNVVFSKLYDNAGQEGIGFIYNLIREGYISRTAYGNTIGTLLDCAYLPLNETLFDHEATNKIPRNIAEKYNVIGVYQVGGMATVATSDPNNKDVLKAIQLAIGCSISFVFSFIDEIQNAIKMQYAVSVGLYATLTEVIKKSPGNKLNSSEELIRLSQDKEIIDLVDMIIFLALQDHASDIHIEPKKHHILLRFRRDGILENKAILPVEILPTLISRIKILAKLDISERRRPQDGRFDFELPQFTVDLRVSLLPSLYGEKAVLRLLGNNLMDTRLSFEELGFSEDIVEDIKTALSSPNGMLFITGPTGSGKTTTLHCALNYICHPGINIVAIEDPIEYEHPNITQVSINTKAGRDFPTVLRSVLRQDPDVIMIGEIRDLETAKIAANAAMTGHMVLTSLHTNDSIQAVTRMVEMGVEHFVVAPSIIGVLGQRLVRTLCSLCREEYVAERSYYENFFDLDEIDELPPLYRSKGCSACNDKGFSGRIAIHEFLGITPELRQCILKGSNYDEFFSLAMSSNDYRPFLFDGLKKSLKGITTLEEVRKAVFIDAPRNS